METNRLLGNVMVLAPVLELEFLITLNKKCFTFSLTIALFHSKHIIAIHIMQVILPAHQLQK